jgi:predicted DNA-binding transcriptional regulator AlpA
MQTGGFGSTQRAYNRFGIATNAIWERLQSDDRRAETAPTFTASSRAIHHRLTCRRQLRTMAQRSVSRLHEGDLSLKDANGAVRIGKWFLPTVLSRRFTSNVSAQTGQKKLITKQEVARLFSVSRHTIDCWLHDGKLPEPKRTFPRQKWDYEELIARTRLKLTVHR